MLLSSGSISSAAISEDGQVFLRNLEINSEFALFGLTFNDSSLARLIDASLDPGSYSVSGQIAEILHDRVLDSNTGVISFIGQNSSVLFNRTIFQDAGSFFVSGVDSGVFYDRVLFSGIGSFLLIGEESGLLFDRKLNAEQFSASVSGNEAQTLYGRVIGLNADSVLINGIDVTSYYNRSISANSESFSALGFNAQLNETIEFSTGIGIYLVSGEIASLFYSGEEGNSEWIVKARRRGRR